MRGRTFKDSYIMLEEFQNATEHELLTVLTRIGEGSKMVVCGDIQQVDIKKPSGLIKALRIFKDQKGFDVVSWSYFYFKIDFFRCFCFFLRWLLRHYVHQSLVRVPMLTHFYSLFQILKHHSFPNLKFAPGFLYHH